MRYPLSTYWKAIVSAGGDVVLAVYLWLNDHGTGGHYTATEKWTLLITVLATLGVYGKKNRPYPDIS